MEKHTIILLFCIITTLAGKLPETPEKLLPSINVEIITKSINTVLVENSEIIKLKNETIIIATENEQTRPVIRYTLGEPYPGDKRLAEASDSFYYQIPQDFHLLLTYPQVGVGGFVTFIEILVDQSSNIGESYIISGGLGQRFIQIGVDAKHITHFQFRASFYGQY